MPAPIQKQLELLPLQVGQVEMIPPVHEHQVVVEQAGIAQGDLVPLGVGIDRRFSSRPAASSRFTRARGAAVQPPGCKMLATRSRPAVDVVRQRPLLRIVGSHSSCLHFPIGGVGQHVHADRQTGLDLVLRRPGCSSGRAALDNSHKQESEGRGSSVRMQRDVNHAGAAAVFDAQQRPLLLRIDILLGMPHRMFRRRAAAADIRARERPTPSAGEIPGRIPSPPQ